MSSSFAEARNESSSVHKSKAKGRNLSFTTTREESFVRSRRQSDSFNLEDYLKYEYFDINPKTDYTYAFSGSYCRSKPDKDVVSPNMSRRRLRSRQSEMLSYSSDLQNLSPETPLQTPSRMDQYEENLMDETHELDVSGSYLFDTRHSGYQAAKDREGMVLRSGSHLHRLSSVIHEHESRSMDSNKASSSYVIQSKNMYNENQNHDVNQNRGSTVSGSSVSSSVSSTISSVTSVRRTLDKQFEEDASVEKGAYEESEKTGGDRSHNSSVVSHMLGGVYASLKRFTETRMYRSGVETFSDDYQTDEPKSFIDAATNTDSVESLSGSVVSSSSHLHNYYMNYESDNLTTSPGIIKSLPATVPSWTERLIDSYTTTTTQGLDEDEISDFESVSASASRVRFLPGGEGRGRGNICTYLILSILGFLNAIWRNTGAVVLKLIRRIVYFFIGLNIWLLARRNQRLTFLCFIIPLLLLLLPLMKNVEFNHHMFSPLHFFGGKSTMVLNDRVTSHFAGFDEQVRQVIVKLQNKQVPPLTAMDIERIIKGVISEELLVVKTLFSQQINAVKGSMASWHTDQKLKYLSLEERIADSVKMTKELEKKLLEAMTVTGKEHKQNVHATREKTRLLEQQIKVLGVDISNLRLSQLEMLAGVKNCCHNDTFFAAVIKSQVTDILTQIMTGGDAGGETLTDNYGGFLSWLNANYVKKSTWEKNLVEIKSEITNRILQLAKEHKSQKIYLQRDGSKDPSLSEEYVRFIVDEAILKFSADKTGMADYAMESVGGSVINIRCTVTYYKKTALVSVFGIPLWFASNSPRTVIQPDVNPGQCWAFKGSQGYLVIQLATAVQPTGFTMEHISKLLSPSGNVDSAPKKFTVFGLNNERDLIGTPLGNFSYSQDGNPIQFFPVQAARLNYFNIVELKILSNHGNPDYTCLYRFRVHGVPYKK